MKNKLLVVTLFLILLLSIFSMVTMPIRATEWDVYPGQSIQEAINAASPGDTIIIHSGTYTEGPQILINKNLTITGTEVSTTIIKPAGDTGSVSDARGWFLVNPDVALNLSNLTLDGLGHNIYQAIRHKGQGTVENCIFENIVYPSYQGFAIVAFGGDVDVVDCVFSNIGRVGILYYGTGVTDSLFSGNSYTGKGDGDWLDYGVEVGAGAHVVISGNIISGCIGIASVDNSTSAGVLVTTYYGAGSLATIVNNDISGCTYGIAVGYDEADTSSVVAYMNNLYNNDWGIDSTAPAVDARFNWWGDASGPYHNVTNPSGLGNNVSDYIDYSPWLGATFQTTPRTYHVNPTGTIQEAIDEASSGDAIVLSAGTYTEGPQFVINKNLAIRGADASTTIIKPASDTGSSGDSRGWFLINSGVTFNLNKVTLDGIGHQIYQAIRDNGQGAIENCIFKNIVYPGYAGFAVVAFGGNVDVINCVFTNIGRVGVLYFGTGITSSVFSGNSYVGKYNGDWLDYGVEVGAGAHVTINGNTISKCTGIASVDGSTSAGILVTTYYGAGSQATITRNDISNCTYGIAVGYDESDTSLVVVHENNIYKNEYGLDTTAPTVDAARNWWGDPTGPYHPELNPSGKGDRVSDNVDFEPWLIRPYPPPTPVETLLYVDPEETVCWTPSYNYVFRVEIKIENVTDLYGYEFKLYWNTTLLDFDYALPEEHWFPNTKIETVNESLGMYWLAFSGLGEQASFNGSAKLVTLYFKIKYDPIYPENVYSLLDLRETKLGTPPTPLRRIPHMVRDGKYWCYSTKPKIMVEPTTSKAKKLDKIFQVNITVQDIVDLYEFEFHLYYNTTLLDVQNVVLGPFLNAPNNVYLTIINDRYNSTHGLVALGARSVSPAPSANGTGVLAIVTFKTTFASICPEPDLECALFLRDTKLVTNKGVQVPHDRINGVYRYTPVIGDLNSDGTVDLHDLYIIALAFGSEPGDSNWNKHADLDGSKEVDVFDMIVVAYNWRRDC